MTSTQRRKNLFFVAMKNRITVRHKGVSVDISISKSVKKSVEYPEYIIADYVSAPGKRIRHVRSTEEAAREKAREIAEALTGDQQEILEWNENQRADIRQALKIVDGTGVGIDRAAFIFAEAGRLIGTDEILTACWAWKNNRPDKPITPKRTDQAVDSFLDAKKTKVSERRHRNLTCYLGQFKRRFAARNLHEITTNHVQELIEEKTWGIKTQNEFLGAVGLLYEFAHTSNRDWVAPDYNPAGAIHRLEAKGGNIQVFQPWEARQMLERIEIDTPELIPFLVLWLFTGCRKEECARVTWQHVHAAVKTGVIVLTKDETKNKDGREVTLLENAKAWLTWWLRKFGPRNTGRVLPSRWNTMTQLDALPKYVARNTGVVWKDNACRHSFITYRCKITGNVVAVSDECGNSPAIIEKHYRKKSVLPETAKEWFAIMPPKEADNVIPMSVANEEKQAAAAL